MASSHRRLGQRLSITAPQVLSCQESSSCCFGIPSKWDVPGRPWTPGEPVCQPARAVLTQQQRKGTEQPKPGVCSWVLKPFLPPEQPFTPAPARLSFAGGGLVDAVAKVAMKLKGLLSGQPSCLSDSHWEELNHREPHQSLGPGNGWGQSDGLRCNPAFIHHSGRGRSAARDSAN